MKRILEKKTGRTFLTIVEGYREPGTGKVKQKTIASLGYLDDLEKDFDDPIEHFKKVAKQMTLEAQEAAKPLNFSFLANDSIDASSILRKNLGFICLSFFYHELKIDKFFINRQRSLSVKYSLNNIFQMLVFSRVLSPCSKKRSFERMDYFFLNFDLEISDIYRSLSHFNFYKDDLLINIHEMVRLVYGRDMSNVYYDVTNYHFEINESDDLHKKGVSKNYQPKPIIQMGLLMDNSGLPITYRLFEGNINDCETLMPVLNDLKSDFGLGRIIVVADKGINTGENIAYNILNKNGYIYSQTVRGGNADLKNFVLSEEGYLVSKDGFKIKSRIVTTDIWITDVSGKKVKVPIEQKQVVFYSPDYAKRARLEREKAIEKAKKLIKFNKNGKLPVKGSFKYIISSYCDKETGEIFKFDDYYSIDTDRIEEEMKFDGYYAIVTSELHIKDNEIIDIYRGLWKIEESFNLNKSKLKTRPVYVSKKEYIEAHFLICFVALLLLRLMEKEIGNKYSTRVLVDAMNNITGTYLNENYYMFDYYNDVVKDLGDLVDVDFSKRFVTLGEIRKIIAKVKK